MFYKSSDFKNVMHNFKGHNTEDGHRDLVFFYK